MFDKFVAIGISFSLHYLTAWMCISTDKKPKVNTIVLQNKSL